ncbi:MAG: hypothetical protein AAF250_09780 [Pseudomonadota bacterium]
MRKSLYLIAQNTDALYRRWSRTEAGFQNGKSPVGKRILRLPAGLRSNVSNEPRA